MLKRSSTSKILAETKITFGYRRPPNLKDLLVRARVPQVVKPKRLTLHCDFANRCNNKKCKFCLLLDKSGQIVSSYTQREYNCKRNVTCKSGNLIYCITCTKCSKQCVGQTGDTLHKRFGAHAGSIGRQNLREDVSSHFNS